MISLRLYTLALGTIGVGLASYALLRRKPRNANDVEFERRTWLNTVGRITDGTVIDVQEITVEANRDATMLIYQYDVAGVSYEASQDVTYLRQWINLHSCRLGVPDLGEVRFAQPGKFHGDCRRLDGATTMRSRHGVKVRSEVRSQIAEV
jgi:hypothetical protein